MITVEIRAHAKYLNFPNTYTVLLPENILKGKRVPLILCLHDLGEDRRQYMQKACPEEMVERHGVALVLPDGRRSCFLNMAHGPRWNDYLGQELVMGLCETFPLDKGKVGVIGAGTGALGALMLARQGMPCVLALPEVRDVLAWDSVRWPLEAEWRGVLEGCEADWQASCWQTVQGAMVGSEAALSRTEELPGLSHWKKIGCEDSFGACVTAALTELTGRFETERI